MANGPENRVTLIDLDVPFVRLVFFFVKAALVDPGGHHRDVHPHAHRHSVSAVFGVGHWGMGFMV